jgi:hypothetical protein
MVALIDLLQAAESIICFGSPQEGLPDADAERSESPRSVRLGPQSVSHDGKVFYATKSIDEHIHYEQLELPPEKEMLRDTVVQGGCGIRRATLKNKEVTKMIEAETRNSGKQIYGFSSPDHEGQASFRSSAAPREQAAASAASPQNNKPRKRVSFQVRSNGEIMAETTVKSLCTVQLSREEVGKLWWNRKERSKMKRRAHRVASRFLANTPQYRLAAEQLLMKCFDESGSKMGWEINQGERDNCFDHLSYEEALRILVNHRERGLEQSMVAAINFESCMFYHKCGKISIASVLEAQSMGKAMPCFTTQQRASMIALQLRQFSDFAACFARILAEGDEKVANGTYDDDDDDYLADTSSSSL